MDLDPDDYENHVMMNGNDDDFSSLVGMTALEQQISATRAYGFGEEIRRRVLEGTSVMFSDRFHSHYEAEAVVRAKLSRSLADTFQSSQNHGTYHGDKNDDKVYVMLVPTAISFPCTLHSPHGDGIEEGMDTIAAFANDVMTIPISLGGFPSVSVPARGETLNNRSVDNSPRSKNNVGTDSENNQIGIQIFAS